MEASDVMVGVNSSTHSRSVLHWAAAEASRRRAALRVVYAYTDRVPGVHFMDGQLKDILRENAERVVAEAVAEARAAEPDITVSGTAVAGDPAPVLLHAAAEAALLVVGSHGHGGLPGMLAGSISQQVATHSPVPVAVVRGRADAESGPIVVGADGSAAGDDAVRLAFEQAAMRGCHLVALFAYRTPLPARGGDMPPLPYDLDQLRTDLERQFTETIEGWHDKYPDVAVDTAMVAGSPGRALVDASREAQLVVVGSRGHGGFAGLMLGSVGLRLLHHADCPVVIVHHH
jgi:nucleotide-binding universal stress UspA family protein